MEKSGYDLVHTDDLAYFAAAHQERECCVQCMVVVKIILPNENT